MQTSPPEGQATAVRRFVDLATSITALPASCGPVRLVAIDGPAGAGKSTFARRLAAAAHDAAVVHTDDFAHWDNQFDWWPRLLDQVITPLQAGRAAMYQRYDWVERRLANWIEVEPAPLIVIEGVGAGRREFTAALGYLVWIDTPAELRLARGIERDGEGLRGFWERWIVGEQRHFAADRTSDRADLFVSGNPAAPHDRQTEFVVAASSSKRGE